MYPSVRIAAEHIFSWIFFSPSLPHPSVLSRCASYVVAVVVGGGFIFLCSYLFSFREDTLATVPAGAAAAGAAAVISIHGWDVRRRRRKKSHGVVIYCSFVFHWLHRRHRAYITSIGAPGHLCSTGPTFDFTSKCFGFSKFIGLLIFVFVSTYGIREFRILVFPFQSLMRA